MKRLIVIFVIGAVLSGVAWAGIPKIMSLQGRITKDGQNVNNPSATLKFDVYNADTDAYISSGQIDNVNIVDGLFDVQLPIGSPTLTYFYDTPYKIKVTYTEGTTDYVLPDIQPFASVPYAVTAASMIGLNVSASHTIATEAGTVAFDKASNQFKTWDGASWNTVSEGLWTEAYGHIFRETGNVIIGPSTISTAYKLLLADDTVDVVDLAIINGDTGLTLGLNGPEKYQYLSTWDEDGTYNYTLKFKGGNVGMGAEPADSAKLNVSHPSMGIVSMADGADGIGVLAGGGRAGVAAVGNPLYLTMLLAYPNMDTGVFGMHTTHGVVGMVSGTAAIAGVYGASIADGGVGVWGHSYWEGISGLFTGGPVIAEKNLLIGGNVSIGGSNNPASRLEVKAVSVDEAPVFIRETSDTNSRVSSLLLKAKSTGNMADGFGPGLSFRIEDNANAEHAIGAIAAKRDGSDSVGKLVFITYNPNASETMTLFTTGTHYNAQKFSWPNATTMQLGTRDSSDVFTGKLAINGNGYLGVGDLSPDAKLDVYTSAGSEYAAVFTNEYNSYTAYGLKIRCGRSEATAAANNGVDSYFVRFYTSDNNYEGSIRHEDGVIAITNLSDRRIKEDIRDTKLGLTDLMKIKVRDFKRKGAPADRGYQTGFIAQELNDVYPNAVSVPQDPNEMWEVNYSGLTPLLVKAVQDLKAENDALKKRIEALENK